MKTYYHCSYNLTFNLLLVTKERKDCFTEEICQRLKEIIEKLCEESEIDLLAFYGRDFCIEMDLSFNPNIMPSKFINSLKTVTSRLIRKEFSQHLDKFYNKPVLWSRGYCLISTGSHAEITDQYLKKQDF